jgi:hypothetical protein
LNSMWLSVHHCHTITGLFDLLPKEVDLVT